MSNNRTPLLVIEDNLADAEIVRIYLEDSSFKHQFYHAESFADGLDIVSNNSIELVLLDLSLNDSIGFKTLKNFLEEVPDIPVIVMTGMNNEIMGIQSVKAGAQDFLVKGEFDAKSLVRTIRYSLQRFKMQKKFQDTAQQLYLSEKRYQEAQEMAKFGTWEMDIVSNEMKWSDEVYRIFGFYPNSITPSLSDYVNYVHVEDKEKVEAFFNQAIKDGQQHHLEHRIVISNREVKHVTIQAKVNYEEATSRIVLIGAIQDITTRKKNEIANIETNYSSGTSQIKNEVLSELGFHIRTPLSSIVNLLYLLDQTGDPKQTDLLDGLKTSVDDLSITINNLLNFSLLLNTNLRLEKEDFNLKEFIQSIEKVARIKADYAKIHLKLDQEPDIPQRIFSDPKKIGQILYNLIDNAIKNNDKNGSIQIKISYKKSGKKSMMLRFEVSDTGRGISKERIQVLKQADRLLEIDPDDKNINNKRHLSMAIVAKLVNILEGKWSIQSKLGLGSKFVVEIPVQISEATKDVIDSKPRGPIKILLVEDHFLNQIATKKVLSSWSNLVEVDIAENGMIAVEKQSENNYDLILMDIQMPIMNGIEATRKIRIHSQIPIIALTANASSQEQEKCIQTGMNHYLSKPFQPLDLYQAILRVMYSEN